MSLEFDSLKSSIDDLDFDLNGSQWMIAGVDGIQCIKEEIPLSFENINDVVVELSIRKRDLPIDLKEGNVAIDKLNDRMYLISKCVPEVEGIVTLWLTERG